jgi:hypothetical protein
MFHFRLWRKTFFSHRPPGADMKPNLFPWSIVLPLLLVSALVLIGADAPGPAGDKKDTDGDGISDYFEQTYFLNYLASSDALEDPDSDGLLNAQEALRGTDPFFADSDFDGIPDDADPAPRSRLFIEFGDPWYTDGDFCTYPMPSSGYYLGVWKKGGAWFSNYPQPERGRVARKDSATSTQSGWYAASKESNAVECLYVALDRSVLKEDLICALHYWNKAPERAGLFVDLLDENAAMLAEDLYGNLMDGTNEEAVVLLHVPTAVWTNAAMIQLRRGGGEVVIFEILCYEDLDADFLDAETERMNGTSDQSKDTDGDGISDYAEYFKTTTNSAVIVEPKPPEPKPPEDEDPGKKTGVIIVDQQKGSDSFTGHSAAVSGKNGPKKTVGKGMIAVDADKAHTLIIKTGNYNESLNISGKNLKVVIAGSVKL